MAVKPKLCMIPSGYKGGASSGDLYSVLPSDGVGDFDFSRSGSATRINKDGLIETVASNVPRLNYPLIDGVVSGCPSLLLEPSRSNLIQYSEDFSQSSWTKFGTSIIPNSIISPNGTLNASRYQGDGVNSAKFLYDNTGSVVNGNTYTMSVFVKKGTLNYCQIFFGSATFNNALYSNFDLENGTIGSSGGGAIPFIEEYGNEWYRVGITANADADGVSTAFLCLANSSTMTRTNAFITSDYIYAYGFQVEQGSFPTSYIPNYGTALGATRSAETCNNSGDANTFNDSEGVLMAEISALADDESGRYLSISNVGNYQIRIGFFSGELYVQIRINGSVVYSHSETVILTNNNKISIKYTNNTQKVYINGYLVNSETISTIFPLGTLTSLRFNNGDLLGGEFYGNTKQIQYFDTALTDTDLEELTSWQSFNEMAESQQYTIL